MMLTPYSVTLTPRHFFGVVGRIKDNIAWVDHDTAIYLAGLNVVLCSVSDGKQRFLQAGQPAVKEVGEEKSPGSASHGFTAVALAPSKRYVAVAEKSERAVATVYDLKSMKKRKTLRSNDIKAKEFVALAFSQDSSVLLTQGGAPDWTLVCWNWAKARPTALVQVSSEPLSPIYSCSFGLVDASVCLVYGRDVCKFYRATEASGGELRLLPPPKFLTQKTIVAHAWLKQPLDYIVLGTERGELMLIKAGNYLCTLQDTPKDALRISCLTATSQGFIATGPEGTFRFYQYHEDDGGDPSLMFSLAHTWKIEDAAPVVCVTGLAFNSSESVMLTVTSNNQIYQTAITSSIAGIRSEDMRPLTTPFHGPGQVTGMSVCVRKPIVATCGADRTVRIWSYADRRLELYKAFQEDVLSVALHPSGLHLCVGFSDKLRVMHLLMDDIRTFRELPVKGCREVQFSQGGHLLAAVNGTVITVYDFFTGEKTCDLRGHNGKVRSLHWGDGDSSLISCGQDGAVYQWDVDECKRIGEFNQKGVSYTSARLADNSILAVGSDGVIKELELPELTVARELEAKAQVNNLCLSRTHTVLYVSTCDEGRPGALRAYEFPLTGEYQVFPCMGSKITKLCLSYDDRAVIVADEEGSMCAFDVRPGEVSVQRGRAMPEMMPWSEEILVTRTDLDEKNQLMGELKTRVDELTLHNEYNLRLKEMTYAEREKEVSEKFTQELDHQRSKLELMKEEKNDLEMEFDDRLKHMEEKHRHELQEIENEYQHKIMYEVEKYQQLQQEKGYQEKRCQEQRELLVSTHDRYVNELVSEFDKKLHSETGQRTKLDDENESLRARCFEEKKQLEEDIDMEIERTRNKYEGQLSEEREATLKYKGENGIMNKKFTVLQKEIEDQKEEIKLLLDKEKELQEQIRALQAEITTHKREIKARDETIGDKEKKIYELKKKNQELEKFKFVLDYKIKELKKQVEPREAEIATMKEQVKKMDTELEHYHKVNAGLDSKIGEMRTRLDELQHIIVGNRKKIAHLHLVINNFKAGLAELVKLIQWPEKLKEGLQHLHKAHVRSALPEKEVDSEVQHEYVRHKEYLETTLYTLRDKYEKEVHAHGKSNMQLMQENLSLIKEIKRQREDNRVDKHALQAQMGVLQRNGVRRPLAALTASPAPTGAGGAAADVPPPTTPVHEPVVTAHERDSAAADMANNRERIAKLRSVLVELEGRVVNVHRPYSKEVLPPMDI